MTYTYPDPGGDVRNIALGIERGGLPVPQVERSGSSIIVLYTADLTAPQKTTLDSLMANPNIGAIPTTANSIYNWQDVMDFRADLKAALAPVSFNIYWLSETTYQLQFNKVLTTSDKNAFKNAILSFLKQIQ